MRDVLRKLRTPPFVSLLQYRLDNWHTTMFVLGVMSMVMVPLAFGLREQRAAAPKPGAAIPQGTKGALQEAFRTRGFWLLTVGFFVCGFHVTVASAAVANRGLSPSERNRSYQTSSHTHKISEPLPADA